MEWGEKPLVQDLWFFWPMAASFEEEEEEGAQEDMKFESRCKICTYTPAKCPK